MRQLLEFQEYVSKGIAKFGSKRALATACGLSPTIINKYTTGEVYPRVSQFRKLVEVIESIWTKRDSFDPFAPYLNMLQQKSVKELEELSRKSGISIGSLYRIRKGYTDLKLETILRLREVRGQGVLTFEDFLNEVKQDSNHVDVKTGLK